MAHIPLRMGLDVAAWSFILWVLIRKLQFYFFPPKQVLTRYRRKPQAYAVITGASAGIGYGFAQELIAHGFGVVLIASRKERLEAAAQKLRLEDPNAIVKTIVWDAHNVDGEKLATALEPVMDLPITMLLNNVGGMSIQPHFVSLADSSAEQVIHTINMNAVFMVQLTRIMIPVLNRNGPSVVIGVGSIGDVGAPWIVLYSAAKAFVKTFCAGLAREAQAEGWKINSLGLVTGQVYSEFATERLSPGSPTSRQYARIVLDRVEMAVDRKWYVVAPFWLHALGYKLYDIVPESLLQKMMVSLVGDQRVVHAKTQ